MKTFRNSFTVFLIIGMLFGGLAAFFLMRFHNYKVNGTYIPATVTGFKVTHDLNDNADRHTYVSFEANGKVNRRLIHYYKSTWDKGDIIALYLQKDGKLIERSFTLIPVGIFGIIALILLSISAGCFFSWRKLLKKNDDLRENGIEVICKVTRTMTGWISLGNKQSIIFFCVDDAGNEYKSDSVFPKIPIYTGDTVTLFVDPNDRTHFLIDV